MIDTLFTRAKVLARFQQSILEPHLSDLADGRHEHGYSNNVIRAYLCAAEKFGRWLSVVKLNTSDVSEDVIARYVKEAFVRIRRSPDDEVTATPEPHWHTLCAFYGTSR